MAWQNQGRDSRGRWTGGGGADASVSLGIDSSGVAQGKTEVVRHFDDIKRKAGEMEGAVDRLNSAFSTLTRMAQAVGLAFGAWQIANQVRDMVGLAARYETLGIVMEQVGRNAGYSKTQVHEFAERIKGMGITMQESRNTVIQLAQAEVDLAKGAELARLAQDAAVIGNINSSEALARLIYGTKSAQVEVLRTMGLNVSWERSYAKLAAQLGVSVNALSEQQKMQARVNEIMSVAPQITGAYEAAMNTAGKQVTSLARYVEDLRVKLGELGLPIFTEIVFGLSDALKSANDQVDKWMKSADFKQSQDYLLKTFENLALAAAGLADVFQPLAQNFANVFGGMIELYNRLPPWMQEVGLIGGLLFGRSFLKLMAGIAAAQGLRESLETVVDKATGMERPPSSWELIRKYLGLDQSAEHQPGSTGQSVILKIGEAGMPTDVRSLFGGGSMGGNTRERMETWFRDRALRREMDRYEGGWKVTDLAGASPKAQYPLGQGPEMSELIRKLEQEQRLLRVPEPLRDLEKVRAEAERRSQQDRGGINRDEVKMAEDLYRQNERLKNQEEVRKQIIKETTEEYETQARIQQEEAEASFKRVKADEAFNRDLDRMNQLADATAKSRVEWDAMAQTYRLNNEELDILTKTFEIFDQRQREGIPIAIEDARKLAEQWYSVRERMEQADRTNQATMERMRDYQRAARDFANVISKGFEDAMLKGEKLSDVVKALGDDILRIFYRVLVTKPLENTLTTLADTLSKSISTGAGSWFSGLFSANGNVFSNGALVPFANGGIVNRPTMFPLGIMGEAGPEAILPLKRGSDGRLGVQSGGGSTVVNIIDQRSAGAPATEVSRSNGPNGTEIIDVIVRDSFNRMASSGKLDKTMNKNWGVSRQPLRRG